MVYMRRRFKVNLVITILLLTFVGTLFVVDRIYNATRSKSPTISDVSYSKQADFILIGCEVKSLDKIDYVNVNYNNKFVEMSYATRVDAQGGNRDRYTVKIPLDAENYEIKIIASDQQGDTDTHIIEK